jgi:hypothetical protein
MGESEQPTAAHSQEEIHSVSRILPITAPCPDKWKIMIGNITI